jgi:plastocyanin
MKLVALVAVLAALIVPSALASSPTLTGTVGPGFTITLKKGKYTFVCDPHAAFMKGSFTVS